MLSPHLRSSPVAGHETSEDSFDLNLSPGAKRLRWTTRSLGHLSIVYLTKKECLLMSAFPKCFFC